MAFAKLESEEEAEFLGARLATVAGGHSLSDLWTTSLEDIAERLEKEGCQEIRKKSSCF